MFDCSGHVKPREQSSRRLNYRVECFDAVDDDADDADDTDSPYFEPTDPSDTEVCGCTRSPGDDVDARRRDRHRRKASRRPSRVPCAVDADSLPLGRPIPLHYDSDMFDTWCNKHRKPKRHPGVESRGDGAGHNSNLKFKTSSSTAPLPPPAPETLARLINQSLSRQKAVGVAVAAPSATTPRYFRRAAREASRRPSRLCLPVASQLDPAVGGRRHGTHGTRSQMVTSSAPVLMKLPSDMRTATRHGATKLAPVGEVKIPVQAHVSYVAHADDSPCRGATHARRNQPHGEIRIPLDGFAAPYLACGSDADRWVQQLRKSSSHRVRRSRTQVHPSRSHVAAHPVLVESSTHAHAHAHAAPLRKRHSVVGAAKSRAASEKPPQKHRAPSVRSRASETFLPHVVRSHLDALATSYEAQLSAPPAQRHRAQTPAQPRVPSQTQTGGMWGHRPDPRLIPVHLLKPRKPESVRQREFMAQLEARTRALAQSSAARVEDSFQSAPPAQPVAKTSAQDLAQSPAQPVAKSAVQPPAQLPAQTSSAVQAAPAEQADRTAQAEQPAHPAHSAQSAESNLTSLLNDLMKNGFDVSNLEQHVTGAAAPTVKDEKAPTPPKSRVGCKPDPRGFYEALYNQQSLARVDFADQMNSNKASTPAELAKSASKHRVVTEDKPREWQSGDEQGRPRSKAESECANYASQDDESVYENQDFWDTLDLNVDLNSVQSMSDGFEGHEDSYKYFRNGQIPSTTHRISSQTDLPQNPGESSSDQRRAAPHRSLHELWRRSERRSSTKPVADSGGQSPGYYHWNDDHHHDRSLEESNDFHEEPSTPATSHGVGVGGGVATPDADVARRMRVSKSLIAEVVEETLERRERTTKRIESQTKMNIGQAIELIKRKSSSMNDALCMEIAKALSDRLIDCETAKSEKEYVTQLKKLRSDHLRHISREVKRLQDLEGFLDDFGRVRNLYDTACAERENEGE